MDAQAQPPAQRPSVHRLRRRLDRALVGGVCAGIADYLGIEPLLARAGMLGVAAFSGIGFVLYPLAWALIPSEGRRPDSWRERLSGWREALAIAILTAATLLVLRRLGLWLGDAILWPLVLVSCGVALIVYQVAAPEWLSPAPRQRGPRGLASPWRRWPAGVLGTVLVIGASVAFLRSAGVVGFTGRVFLETVVLVLAFALVVAPYLLGLARRLTLERTQRIRSEERAEMAAHLHDSVLQTLALIQRRAGDPGQVIGLARRQERELRDWLLARDGAGQPATLRAGLEQVAREIEADHAVRVEIVVVGDWALDERLQALLAATREALTNAAKFAGVDQIDIYAEVTPERVDVFVRDRGVGFDPEQVPADRQGLRWSIHERMTRHGGAARVRSAPGQGTEVELGMSRVPA